MAELESPLSDVCEDDTGRPPVRSLLVGGMGARGKLQRMQHVRIGGFWDCALLGHRRWRLFQPETSPMSLGGVEGANESAADCFARGPDDFAVQACFIPCFTPAACWELEQGP